MNDARNGWVIGLSGIALILAPVGQEFASLGTWDDATTPAFVGRLLFALGGAAASFIGGKMIPTSPRPPA